MTKENRPVVGLTEKITLVGKNRKKKEVVARIDTGAERSSIDLNLAAKLELGPILQTKIVRSSLGSHARPYIETSVIISGKRAKGGFTLADRRRMKYKVLIGQNILRKIKALVDTLVEEKVKLPIKNNPD